LEGYSANGVTLTEPASVPGSAVDEPDDGDHDASRRVDRAEPDDASLAGAEPDAGHAAAGAALRPDAAAEVQQLGVGGDEAQLLGRRWRARPRRPPRRRP
jgi:hypothetical protein